jgi:hypothetical protein
MQCEGTYNGRLFVVSVLIFLQKKTPFFGLETVCSSPRETTARARAPRPNRRLEQRCTTSSSRLDDSLGSHAGARWFWCGRARDGDMVLRAKIRSSDGGWDVRSLVCGSGSALEAHLAGRTLPSSKRRDPRCMPKSFGNVSPLLNLSVLRLFLIYRKCRRKGRRRQRSRSGSGRDPTSSQWGSWGDESSTTDSFLLASKFASSVRGKASTHIYQMLMSLFPPNIPD